MLRPLPLLPSLEAELDDSCGSFGGLADVLEPDPDAVTSLRRVELRPASRRNPSFRGQAARSPVSVRAPVQIQDFAFADTVFASELVENAEGPASAPIFLNDDPPGTNAHCVTPLAFPLPPPSGDVALPTRVRGHGHLRHALRGSLDEMREVWANTAEIVHAEVQSEGGPATTTPFVFFLRRALALWSCFQWSQADLTRAAMIGVGVFVVAGALGATTMDFTDDAGSGRATSSEVRARRTLDQHTAKKIVIRNKR
jgi:hypothetical protein